MKKQKVLVLCGGKSAEHLVSLVSAKTVLENIDRARYEPELVFIDGKGRWLKADPKKLQGRVSAKELDVAAGSKELVPTQKLSGVARPDVVFPVLHGPLGEDGTVQGLFELAGIPYVGCGVLGSAVGMDKEISKQLSIAAGLPILPYADLHDPRLALDLIRQAELTYPVFVKPARMGSSVGVSKVRSDKELAKAVKLALNFDDKVIIEQGIEAREVECAVLGDPWSLKPNDPLAMRSSIVGEIIPNADFYDYETKYLAPDRAGLKIPAELSPEQTKEVQTLAERAFMTLDCYGMARVDFLMDKKTGELWFNEVNTIPGFTAASMYPMLWRESGLPTPELVHRLIQLAVRRAKARSRLKTTP